MQRDYVASLTLPRHVFSTKHECPLVSFSTINLENNDLYHIIHQSHYHIHEEQTLC